MDDALQVSGPLPQADRSGKPGEIQAHILVADDNPHVLELCACYLEEERPLGPKGLTSIVHYTESGQEAVEFARTIYQQGEQVAYAILDFVLPGDLDGIDTICKLWQIDPGIHCTLITGAEERLEAGVQRLPADLLDRWDYLPKPFKRFEFMLHVRRSLSSWYVRKEERDNRSENETLLARLECLNHNLENTIRERTIALARRSEEAEAKNRELEDALFRVEEAHAQLLQQEKMASIGQMAAGVAHELNNPIGYVGSNLHTLERYVVKVRALIEAYEKHLFPEGSEDSEELRELRKELKVEYILEDLPDLVKESLEGTERVRKIVSDLKGFSRPDEKEPKEFDLNEGLKSTLNIVNNEIKYRAEVALDLGEIPPVWCIPGQINQVFMNLLINAGQAIEKNGEIHISTRQEGDSVLVRIRDTGCGIEKECLDRVFEPFYTTKGVGKGTGLGLSITCEIVRTHGGEISVESEVGEGTCFTVRLPVARMAVPEEERDGQQP
ncbi:MAG: ATP-binding protein [Planctomycetota bacterium]